MVTDNFIRFSNINYIDNSSKGETEHHAQGCNAHRNVENIYTIRKSCHYKFMT